MMIDRQRAHLIVAPTDFSEAADLALSEAAREAAARGAALLLMHVLETPVYPVPAHPLPELPAIVGRLRAQAETELAARAERVRQAGVPCETLVSEGAPADAILRVLEQRRPELVVMPTQGLGGLKRFLFGSV
ncbi:MAG TPA: universal stress protein, partial [Polyangiaceae bacterium]|nr:universal stress protein [Polyangiaceae bacterium]